MRKRLEEIAEVREKRNLNLCESTAPVQPEYEHINVGFNKIKLGPSVLNDPTLNLGLYKRVNKKLGDKEYVLNAILRNDLDKMREISNFYYMICITY